MKNFLRRTYSFAGLLRDLARVLRQPALALRVGLGSALPPAFRERLYLVVTAVNGCRYCSYLHTRSALAAGLTARDVELLLGGAVQGVPDSEVKALVYAQHWAENGGRSDPESHGILVDAYGPEQTRAIQMALYLIQIGNLTGNSFDYLLFLGSGGRLGSADRHRLP